MRILVLMLVVTAACGTSDGTSDDDSTTPDAARLTDPDGGIHAADAAPQITADAAPQISADAALPSGPGELICNDGLDQDGDTQIDCDDPDCDGACSLLLPVNLPIMICAAPKVLLRVPVLGLPAALLDAQDVATITHFVATTDQPGLVESAGLLISMTHQRIGDPWLDVTVPGGDLHPQRLFQDTMPFQGPMVLDEAILGPVSWNAFNGRPFFSDSASPYSGAYAASFYGSGYAAAGDWHLDFGDDGLGMTGELQRAEFILCVAPPAD
jgi:hypothetical protein